MDWILDSFRPYLIDQRLVQPLQQILANQRQALGENHGLVIFHQLLRIAPNKNRQLLVAEVCAANPTVLQFVDEVPFHTLPEADACMQQNLHNSAKDSNRSYLGLSAEFLARFATAAIYEDVLALYRKVGQTDSETRGSLLAISCVGSERALPLLELAMPFSSTKLDSVALINLGKAYSPSLERVFFRRVETSPPEQAGQAAWFLSQHAPASMQTLLRARLEKWRSQWRNNVVPASEGYFERDLVVAVREGKHWHLSPIEFAKLIAACVSSACKSNLQ